VTLEETLTSFPKIELHVHLEGSIRPETLLKLAERNKIELPAKDLEGLKDWYKFRNFERFVEVYIACSKAIKTPEDIELIAAEFARGQAEQNILYTEAHYTAETIFVHCGIPYDEQFDALSRGLAAVPETRVQWITDIVRDWDVERGQRVAEWAVKGMGRGVCAIGLSGFELQNPVSRHAEAFAFAKKAGLPISAHCGETQGPDSIREVLDAIQPNRIGHGVRCVESGPLIRDLRDSQIHIEVNPSSNVCLGVFASLADHTLPKMLDEGLSVSINSDDPPMFSTTLTDEYIRCASEFGLTPDIFYTLGIGAIDASFQSAEAKVQLKQQYRELASVLLD
jgi:adenosine deaminase